MKEHKGKVVSIINMKGGVGKTTLSIGISDYLAEIGNSVLIIDADPQFNGTQAMLDTYKSKEYNDFESESNYYNNEVIPNTKTISGRLPLHSSLLAISNKLHRVIP